MSFSITIAGSNSDGKLGTGVDAPERYIRSGPEKKSLCNLQNDSLFCRPVDSHCYHGTCKRRKHLHSQYKYTLFFCSRLIPSLPASEGRIFAQGSGKYVILPLPPTQIKNPVFRLGQLGSGSMISSLTPRLVGLGLSSVSAVQVTGNALVLGASSHISNLTFRTASTGCVFAFGPKSLSESENFRTTPTLLPTIATMSISGFFPQTPIFLKTFFSDIFQGHHQSFLLTATGEIYTSKEKGACT